MRLIVLSELFLPTKGGTAVWAAEVYRRLGRRDIHLVTADVPGAAAVDAAQPNTVHRLPLTRVAWLRPESLAMYARFFARTLALATTRRIDAIHALRALPEGLVAWGVARLTGRPVAIYAHGEELTGWGAGGKFRVMRFVLRRADTVIANSENTRELLRGMGVAASRIALIHPGVDVERFRPGLPAADLRAQAGAGAHDTLVFSVGRLARHKGFDHAIRALAKLRGEGLPIRYALAGIGDDAAYLEGLIAELGVGDAVIRLGAVADADLPRWFNACDVFLMPNREVAGDNEGFGMVFVEAAACGRTSVAGASGGTGSAVLHNSTGLRVDGRSVEAIADALRALYGDPALRTRLAAAALARAQGEFAWERVADATRALHQSGYKP
jgi:phosphatidylinositol alpha-1,6-mannosyltransferase